MTEMEGSVHVRVREGPHPFGLLSSNLGWCGSLSGYRVEVGARGGRSIHLEELFLGPLGLCLLFELDEVVSLGSLYKGLTSGQ
jgi:hypothetical protein